MDSNQKATEICVTLNSGVKKNEAPKQKSFKNTMNLLWSHARGPIFNQKAAQIWANLNFGARAPK